MPKTRSQPTKPARKQRRPAADPMAQMRDLLLGATLQRLGKATDAAIATQKQRLQRQQQQLSRRIERRSKELTTRVARLSRKLANAQGNSRRALATLQQEHGKALRALQQELVGSMQAIRAELATTVTALEQRLTKAIEAMQHGKTDRSALASLFEDFAQRVAGGQKKRA